MNRESIYMLPESSEESTFCYDDSRPSLPLPKLEDTMERYYESLKPFGTAEELQQSRKVIDDFQNGIGKKLHAMLAERAQVERNWVAKYWEDYAYGTLRLPLIPYCVMAQPLILESVGIEVSPENFLKNATTLFYYNMVFWKLLRREKLKPMANADKTMIFSSELYRRLYNTARQPGETMDQVTSFFKTEREGLCPSHIIIIYKGRIFKINGLDANGEIVAPQDIFLAMQQIQTKVESENTESAGVPLLTNDDRTAWARNRQHLSELSEHNKNVIKEIESGILVISLDTHSPSDYSELSGKTLTGDMHSKWADKSSANVVFKNGKVGCIGEHSCYDGTISMSTSLFVLLSGLEEGEPDWTIPPKTLVIPVELVFDVDVQIKDEIKRMEIVAEKMQNCVGVTCDQFTVYGKDFMKAQKLHPDSFVQTALLLAYHRMHKSYAPTYETAMMRQFYQGRTETVRSCSLEVVRFVEAMENEKETTSNKIRLFKDAANKQMALMNEARKGNGVDRHLFGLWCTAYDNDIDIPELYSDALYTKSGGGGNFILSTSTLGYTINTGYVAPMCLDGYGVFYSMLGDCIWTIISAYKDSEVTSCFKLRTTLQQVFVDLQNLFNNNLDNKL